MPVMTNKNVINTHVFHYSFSFEIMSVTVQEQNIGSLFFKHPANIFISGPSGSGKTEFVKKLIQYKEDLFDILPQRIVWCYKEGNLFTTFCKNAKI